VGIPSRVVVPPGKEILIANANAFTLVINHASGAGAGRASDDVIPEKVCDITKTGNKDCRKNKGTNSGDTQLTDRFTWIKPYGELVNQNEKDGIPGYNAHVLGIALGVDDEITDGTRAGIAFAYAQTDIDGDNSSNGAQVDVQTYQAALYGNRELDDSKYTAAKLVFGWSNNNAKHLNSGLVVKADYNSWYSNLNLEMGKAIELSPVFNITPLLGLNYIYVSEEGYTEKNTGVKLKSRNDDSLVLGVGVNAAYAIPSSEESWQKKITGHLNVGYDLLSTASDIKGSVNGTPFNSNGAASGKVEVKAGVGMNFSQQGPWSVSINYDTTGREKFLEQQVSATIRYKW
jgi:outer membrane autotransporter protein